MFSAAAALAVDENQKRELESLARAGTTPQKLARQCEVILLASQGIPNHAIAQQTGLSRPTVIATRKSFLTGGLEALRRRQKRKRRRPVLDCPNRGWPCKVDGSARMEFNLKLHW